MPRMPRMPRMPKGTITFLFTDIEGSTRMWEAHPRAMQAVLARHDTILREAIEQNGGYVFKTMGDAFCAAFPTAPETLQSAIEAQRALQAADWETSGVGSIKVRMALHTGAAEVRDKDYFGLPLNRAARLLSAGHGGQILLSLPTQQLVRDLMPPDTDLLDLGECDLKDLIRPEHIYQLVASDLPRDFPPIKTLGAHAHSDNSALLTQGTQAVQTMTIVEPEPQTDLQLRNPYKGLRAFQEADAPDFFGREELTERLLARMAEDVPLTHFLAVVGPSGSGKSSVVRAGLVPALRQGGVTGSERWLIVEMLPGNHPFEELEALLLNIAVNPPASLMEQLQADERGLVRAVKRILPRDETIELVLVIDQFEEVFTLVEEEPVRVHFLESLHAAVTDPRSRLRVIVTLRADFFDRPLLYPDPGELMRQRTAVVLPLAADELERAIVKPAEQVGVALEPELVATIIKDVGEQPGALPLLQYAMTELFEKRVAPKRYPTMTLAAYRESGGVLGALARRADELYEGLREEEQEATRQLFLRLVTLGEGVEDTRRRVRLSELQALGGGKESLDRVLDVFGKYRLLTFDRDPVTKGATVEVAHEALIRTWAKLREWLDASRSDLRVQRQLLTASGEWAEAGKDPSFLATGARLAQFEALREGADRAGGVALTTEERAYLQGSIEERGRQEAAERERQERELELQKRAANRLRYLVAGLGAFLVIAIALSGWAVNRSQAANDMALQAQTAAVTAVANFANAEAQRLASEGNVLLQTDGDPEAIALLSLRSINTQYSPQGDTLLLAAANLEYPLHQFIGHTEAVWGVALSPDGKFVLTSSADKTVRLWDTQTDQELRQFTGHTERVEEARFSPDGKYVLTGSDDKTARLWDAQSGKELRAFSGHTGMVWTVAFSPDGKWVLTGGEDKTARLWDAQTGAQLRVFTHTDGVSRAVFSPDGKYVLAGGGYTGTDSPIQLWDAQTGQELRQFTGYKGDVRGLAFSPDGKWLLSGGEDSTARLWDTQTGQELRRFIGHTSTVVGVAFLPDGKHVVTASEGGDNTARLWDAQTGQELRRFTGGTPLHSLAVSLDGKYMLTCGDDKLAKLWNIWAPHVPPQLMGHTSSVYGVMFSPDGKYVLTSSSDKTARLWDAQTGHELRQFTGHTDGLTGAKFSPDGKYVLTGSRDKTARLWDAKTGQELRQFTGHTSEVRAVAFSPDGKTVLTASKDKTARLWDAQTGAQIRVFTGHTDWIFGAVFSPDGKYVLTASIDKTARLWDAQTGQELRAFTGNSANLDAAVFSPDGRYVLTASDDKTARLWDAQTGEQLRIFSGHTDEVWTAAYSQDGKTVLTGSKDSTVRLWDAQTGQELRRFFGHTNGVVSVAFSPNGKYVVTGGYDQTARLWYVDYHEDVRYLCSRLQRDFTDDERTQYNIKDKEPTCPNK